jgi:transcriptional regulator with XRE-family HTH domain
MKDVKELRESMKMTQKQFAEYCGVTERTVQKWEAGNTIPPIVSKFLTYVDNEFNSGDVIKNEGHNSIVGKDINSQPNKLFEQIIGEIAEQRKLTSKAHELVSKRDEQIDRLISLLERK